MKNYLAQKLSNTCEIKLIKKIKQNYYQIFFTFDIF